MFKKVLLAALAVVMFYATIGSTGADARWRRSFSDIDEFVDDVAICEEGITIGVELRFTPDGWEGRGNETPPVLGQTTTPVTIDFWGSAADAEANDVNNPPILQISVTPQYVGDFGDRFQFIGESTDSLPAGLANGDQIFAREAVDLFTFAAVALTVGDPVYECEPVDPGPRITGNAVGVTEGDTGTTTVDLTFSLSEPTDEVVTVDYTSQTNLSNSAVAIPGDDYAPANGTLTFEPGETEQTVTVTVFGDTNFEPGAIWGDWGFLELSNPTNAFVDAGPSLIESSAVFVILNDDEPVIDLL